MRLIRFTAWGIHGYLDFEVPFHAGLTFLTGINGAGKTTVLNAIVSILSPSLNVLAELHYKRMVLELDDNGTILKFTVEKRDQAVIMHLSSVKDIFTYFMFATDSETSPYRERDAELEYYRTILSANANNSVLKAISALPTPMFLGLDRRASIAEFSRRIPTRSARFARNIFGTSLYQSFIDAIVLAEGAYHDVLISLQRLDLQVRKEVLLNALKVELASEFNDIVLPTQESLAEISSMRRDIEALPRILGLEQGEVFERLLPFLNTLIEIGKFLLPFTSERERSLPRSMDENDREVIARMTAWGVNYSQFERIRFISEVIRKYNKDRDRLRRRSDQYLRLVNNFLKDSEKSLSFDEAGRIRFYVQGLKEPTNIKALSSGEAQIFVLLSHLFFNPAASKANVFIIDEPELSLHIEWQELFVASMQEANSSIQYILATHSPSIILERTKDCIDVIAKKKRAH